MPKNPLLDGPPLDINEPFPTDPFEQQKRVASIMAEEARFALPEKHRLHKQLVALTLARVTDHQAYLMEYQSRAAQSMMDGLIRLNKHSRLFEEQGETLSKAVVEDVIDAQEQILAARYMLGAWEASRTLPGQTEPAAPAERLRYLLEVLNMQYAEAAITDASSIGPMPPKLEKFADAMVAGMAAYKISTTGAQGQVGKALMHEYQNDSDPLMVHLLTAVASRPSDNVRDSELVAFLHELRRGVDRLGERYERDRKREVYDVPLENIANAEGTPFGGFENEALVTALQTALETLSPSEQEVVKLCFYGGKTQAEAAELRGTSEKTVSVQSSNAIRKMREAMRRLGYNL